MWAKLLSENRKFTDQCAKASGKERSSEREKNKEKLSGGALL